MTPTRRFPALGVVALIGYDTVVRPWMRCWGATEAERVKRLPGDEIVEDVMTHYTRAVTIGAPPTAVWPWLVQIGDRRAGFYSYDWIERFVFPGMVHYVDRTHSATRIHPELQDVRLGDRINTGSVGRIVLGSPVTVLEPNRTFVMGTWAFILEPLSGDRTRLLVRERDTGWLRLLASKRSGLLRAMAGLIDYIVAEPLHFAMVRRMMLGLKQRAETSYAAASVTERG
ncbi:MAG TPA: hypothetical protein VFQ15_08580 [Jiangellaceae bacterium]|nr:hypothetical protein [Jiangellaceae bacterium]